MTEELKKQSMNALKEFAKHKKSYEKMSNNLNINEIRNYGNLFYGIQDIKLFKSDVIFSIRWTNKIANLYFINLSFQDMDNKSVFSSDEILFEFNNKKLEFTAGGSHWILE
ncbi:MAG: hypothetical protein IJ727_02685 [Treponema sp.]|nr:hypothetical protein [Treponema sp.]